MKGKEDEEDEEEKENSFYWALLPPVPKIELRYLAHSLVNTQ